MMELTEKQRILDFLDEKGISYVLFSHPVTDDLEGKLKNDAEAGVFGATHCKNLVLTNRQKTRLYLLTLSYGARFRTGPVSRQMGSGRLNFAEPEILASFLHTVSGRVSPLELIFDEEHRIAFYMDVALKGAEKLCFHPADDTCTVVLENAEFFGKLLPAMGRSVGFVDPDLVEE